MALTGIPIGVFVPGVYVELGARSSGLPVQPHETLLIGQKLASGTAVPGEIYSVDSASEASILGGAGSQIHGMVTGYKANDNLTPTSITVVEDAAGTAAEGLIEITGTATESRALAFYAAGVRFVAGIATGDTATTIAAKLVAAAASVATDLPVTVDDDAGDIAVTAKHSGSIGNQIFVGHSQLPGERPPSGVTITVTQLTGGATDPSFAGVVSAMGDVQFNTVATGLVDNVATALLVEEMERRWSPLAMIDGVLFGAKADSRANLTTLGNSFNSGLFVLAGTETSPLVDAPWVTAAKVAALSATQAQVDPSLSPIGDVLVGSRAAKRVQRFTFEQRNTLLSDGIATLNATPDGRQAVERLVTTYQKNAQNLPDSALRDLGKVRTLSAMRYSVRVTMARKYSKAKLSDDSPILPSGQVIMTPSLFRAEMISIAQTWIEAGWMEGGSLKQFKKELVVERSQSDSSRLEALISPNLMDQLYVVAANIAAVG